jgi:hypothetical protein
MQLESKVRQETHVKLLALKTYSWAVSQVKQANELQVKQLA